MNHPCPRFEPELSAYLDGETTPALRAEIETHLRVCEACGAAVAQLRGVSRVLRRWDAQETRYATSSGFRNRVFAKVGAETSPPRADAVWRIAASVALVAAGAGAFALVTRRTRDGENVDVARLVKEEFERHNRSAMTTRTDVSTDMESTEPPAPLERVDPLGPVVASPTPDDESTAPPTLPDTWEQRGDKRYLREALPDHDDYVRERGALRLEEQLLRANEPHDTAHPNRPTTAPPALSALATFLGEVRVATGSFKPFNQVQVWPIELTGGRGADASRIMPSEKAIQEKLIVSEGPVRETVVAENRNKRSVLVLAGDVLCGGDQDRVAREDVLIGPNEQLSIQTYLSGRPRRTTSYRTFTSSKGVAPADLRALVAADRTLLCGGFGQDRFNDAVADTLKSLVSLGGNGSLDNLFTNYQLSSQCDKYVASFEKRLDASNVVGLAVSAGSRLLGVEVFGDHATFREHRSRLVRSYVLAALASSPDGTRLDGLPPSRDAVVAVVASAPRAEFHDEPPAVSGTVSVFRGVDGAFGYGLLDGSRVVHALLFPTPPSLDAAGGRGGRIGGGAVGSPGDAPSSGDGGGAGGAQRGNGGAGGGVEPK